MILAELSYSASLIFLKTLKISVFAFLFILNKVVDAPRVLLVESFNSSLGISPNHLTLRVSLYPLYFSPRSSNCSL